MYTYSGTPAGLDASLTAVQVHSLMKTPTVLARRMRDITKEGFLADWLLTGRYAIQGGAIAYPTSDTSPFPKDNAEIVAPGSQYALTQMDGGQLAIAQSAKNGIATHVWDEEISRLLNSPVNDGLNILANGVVRFVDSTAMAVVQSKVTQTYASQAWSTAAGIVNGVLGAQAALTNLKAGVNPTAIVLSVTQYSQVMATLALAGVLPRENVNANPFVTGNWPNVLGFTWTASPNAPFTEPTMIDRDLLGGMADENLQSPEFHKASGSSVEVAVDRLQGRDGYELRARRVCVPVVTRPWAAIRITGTGL